MPNLPRPRLRRSPRVGDDARSHVAPEPNVETVEAPGLRWINIERPGPIDRSWLPNRAIPPVDYLFERCEGSEEIRENLPGEQSIVAFWIVIVAIVILRGGMLAYFRKRGWL